MPQEMTARMGPWANDRRDENASNYTYRVAQQLQQQQQQDAASAREQQQELQKMDTVNGTTHLMLRGIRDSNY